MPTGMRLGKRVLWNEAFGERVLFVVAERCADEFQLATG
jgi:hypothetical protein